VAGSLGLHKVQWHGLKVILWVFNINMTPQKRGRGMSSICLDVTSLFSHSYRSRELRFGTQTSHLSAAKLTEGIFEIWVSRLSGLLAVQ